MLDTAKEMGYFPNAVARALKTNRSYNLGILFMDENHSGLTHHFFMNVLNSFKKVAESNGYDITFIQQNIGTKPTTFLEHCLYRKVDGVCIACLDFYTQEVQDLVNSPLPCVTIDHIFDNSTTVQSDNYDGMYRLTSYAIQMGHRQIAYVHGQRSSVTERRVAGFRSALLDHGLPLSPSHLVASRYDSPEAGRQAIVSLLALPNRPTCILMPDDISTLGAMNALTEHGIHSPADMSIAGYDGIPLTQMLTPQLTTIAQDTQAMGAQAALALINKVENPKTNHNVVISIESTLLTGHSIGKLVR